MGSAARDHTRLIQMAAVTESSATEARKLFDKYDADKNGTIDHREMQQLIVDYLKNAMSDSELGLMNDPLQEFSEGSRMYCMYSLNIIAEDKQVTFEKFHDWLQSPENFLEFPMGKFQVMMWAFDVFEEFDLDGDGQITREEFDMAANKVREELQRCDLVNGIYGAGADTCSVSA